MINLQAIFLEAIFPIDMRIIGFSHSITPYLNNPATLEVI